MPEGRTGQASEADGQAKVMDRRQGGQGKMATKGPESCQLLRLVASMHAFLAKRQRRAFDASVGRARNSTGSQLCNGISLVKHQIKRSKIDNFQYDISSPGRMDSWRG
jgi:hypothetical protein